MTSPNAPLPDPAPPIRLTRHHHTRLMQVWRSAGWPCRDGIEIDLLAAGCIALHADPGGLETLKLTEDGIRTLAAARQRNVRAVSSHDRLAHKFAAQLMQGGRIVWAELSLHALLEHPAAAACAEACAAQQSVPPAERPLSAITTATFSTPLQSALWAGGDDTPAARRAANVWRMARPDLYSVRNTSVPSYLQPMVHEIKYSRADLLSDLRHEAKRQAYHWLCEECYYVFPAGIAEPEEIPEQFGIWVLHGGLDTGRFEQLRPARHRSCTLPFAVWMALCKSTPLRAEEQGVQCHLGEPAPGTGPAAPQDGPP